MTAPRLLHASRLTLRAATAATVAAEMAAPDRLAHILGADVPAAWPPRELAEALPWFLDRLRESDDSPWYSWYALESQGERKVLIGGAGFLGPAADRGTVTIGYSVLPPWRGRGFASEMVESLAGWAFSHPEVLRITAETTADNGASMAVLARCGFLPSDSTGETRHFQRLRR